MPDRRPPTNWKTIDWSGPRCGTLPSMPSGTNLARRLPVASGFVRSTRSAKSPDAAAWLINERRVAGLAVDTMSLDPGASRDFKAHKLWLPSGRWGIENIAGLDKVPAIGATLVVGLPRVKGASAAPSRIFALV